MKIFQIGIQQYEKTDLENPKNWTYSLNQKKEMFLENVIEKNVGQDYLLYKRKDDLNSIFCICDGHGPSGEHFSYIASHLIVNSLLEKWSELDKLLDIDRNKINQIISEIFVSSEKKLLDGSFESIDNGSGTTISIAMIFRGKILITSNVGDSPILWKGNILGKKNNFIECSVDHNCDNKEAVQFYLDHLKIKRDELGENIFYKSDLLESELLKLKPKPIYCSRINCLDGPIWAHLKNSDNSLKKLPMYEYINNEECVISEETYEVVSEYFPHGIQSIRYPETYIREDGRMVVKRGLENQNWGSALSDGPQVLRVFGDFNQGEHTPCIPSIKILDINGGSLLLGSDGLLDLFNKDEIMNLIDSLSLDEDISTIIESKMFNAANLNDYFEYIEIGDKKYPKWDDVSGLIIKI